MSFLEILALAFALSLDAFAVSLAAAAAGHAADPRSIFRLSFHFGLFQFLMPILGWGLGRTIAPLVARYDQGIAFVLLTSVGLHMLTSAMAGPAKAQTDDPSRGLLLVMLSTATSIDALAAGLGLAMLRVSVWYPAAVIGIVTASMCLIAIAAGARIGEALGKRAQLAGAIVLLLIAARILVNR